MAESITILARGLTKHFGDFTAVDDVNFEVQRGEIFGFLGPNGSGKTTTIRMLLGLVKPSTGAIEVLGMRVDGDTSKIRPRVGYMSQRFSLYNDLTVLQNLNFYGVAYGLAGNHLQARIHDAIRAAGLEGREHARTKELSGGWRQRLALSAAILHRPEVLFLDEPTAGVDPLSRRAFWDLLYKLVSEGITVFVTTHYMDEAEHCHRLAFIQHGRIIAAGTMAEIRAEKMKADVLEIAPPDVIAAMKVLSSAREVKRLQIREVELYGSLVHVVAPDMKRRSKDILALLKKSGIQPGHASVIEPSLEDVFIACMKT
jgi:ABC-2 type transport system ATP-binding protein